MSSSLPAAGRGTRVALRSLGAAAALSTVLAACADDAPSGPTLEPTVEVIASPDAVWLAAPGDLAHVRMAVWQDGELVSDSALAVNRHWVSRAPPVARVTIGYDAQAVAAGSTWLVASYGTARDSVRVHVNPPAIPAEQPVWRFTVAVGVRAGPPAPPALAYRLESLFAAVNEAFNPPGMFRGRFEFVLDSVFVYDADDPVTAYELGLRPRSAQYLWLFDPRAPFIASGYYLGGAYQTVGVMTDMFNEGSDRVLVHEVGHSRGAADMYRIFAWTAPGPDQAISHFPRSIMNDNIGSWDAVSRYVIDRNADVFPVHTLGWNPHEFPSAMRVRVIDRDRRPVAGAAVTVRGSSDLAGTLASGTTDAQGMFTLPPTPFRDPAATFAPGCALALCLNTQLLIEASRGGDGGRNWIRVSDVVLGHWREPGAAYVHTIRFGEVGRY